MPCGRIFLVAVCLCTPLAPAQDHSPVSANAGQGGSGGQRLQPVPDFRTPRAANPSEPWRILPKPDSDRDQGLTLRTAPAATPSAPWRIFPEPDSDKDRVWMAMTPEMEPEGIIVSPDGPLAAGTTCYAIRNFVVARDAKNADSVHPDRYSTCAPATKFRLRTPDDHFAR
jgi:hypothetical protein